MAALGQLFRLGQAALARRGELALQLDVKAIRVDAPEAGSAAPRLCRGCRYAAAGPAGHRDRPFKGR